MTNICLFCGGEASAPDHLVRCDGRQGQIEALDYSSVGHVRRTDPDTSHQAAESIQATAGDRMLEALAYVKAGPNQQRSCDEIEAISGLRHQSVSRRLTDLAQAGYIRDSGLRRRSRAGRLVIVWEAVR